MASVGGDVAGDDWDDFGLAALGLHMRNGSGSPVPETTSDRRDSIGGVFQNATMRAMSQ
jgi:hypothetical protein